MNKLALLALAFCVIFNASALPITPSSTPQWTHTDPARQTAAQIATLVGISSLTEVYKQEVGGSEGGTLASSYTTTFSNTPSDPANALIDYISGSFITGGSIFLYVKDGNNTPSGYIFDISGWNGTEDISITGFWPQQGGMSHVTILTGPARVPDGGTTVALLGFGIAALGFSRRFIRR